jgi:hypothetical protein
VCVADSPRDISVLAITGVLGPSFSWVFL